MVHNMGKAGQLRLRGTIGLKITLKYTWTLKEVCALKIV
jgi:hypothetical protein